MSPPPLPSSPLAALIPPGGGGGALPFPSSVWLFMFSSPRTQYSASLLKSFFVCASLPLLSSPPFLGWSAGRLTGSLTKKGRRRRHTKSLWAAKEGFSNPSLVGGFFLPKKHCSSPSNHNVATDRLLPSLSSPNYLDQIFPVKRRERV